MGLFSKEKKGGAFEFKCAAEVSLDGRAVIDEIPENIPLRGSQIEGPQALVHEGPASEVAPLRPCSHGEVFGVRLIMHENSLFILFATMR